jgi:TusA-related sulfurtransferase
MNESSPITSLDLRTTKCPLNFVKAKLALEKLQTGDILEIWISASSESALNIPNSLAQEGHTVVPKQWVEPVTSEIIHTLWVQKA